MKRDLIPALALGALSMLPADAHAAPVLTQNAKVLAVAVRSDIAGSVMTLQIDFDQSLGQNCTPGNNQTGVFSFAQSDPLKEIKKVSMEAMRQMAVSAKLSGRRVNVETTQCLSGGASVISWMGIF